MNISKWKIVWSFVTGGGAGVTDYLLGLLKQALGNLANPTKEKIQAVLNFSMKALSVLKAVQVFIPVRWQTAFLLTVEAVVAVVDALQDLEVTGADLQKVITGFNAAYEAWNSPDDDTCVDCIDVEFKELD